MSGYLLDLDIGLCFRWMRFSGFGYYRDKNNRDRRYRIHILSLSRFLGHFGYGTSYFCDKLCVSTTYMLHKRFYRDFDYLRGVHLDYSYWIDFIYNDFLSRVDIVSRNLFLREPLLIGGINELLLDRKLLCDAMGFSSFGFKNGEINGILLMNLCFSDISDGGLGVLGCVIIYRSMYFSSDDACSLLGIGETCYYGILSYLNRPCCYDYCVSVYERFLSLFGINLVKV